MPRWPRQSARTGRSPSERNRRLPGSRAGGRASRVDPDVPRPALACGKACRRTRSKSSAAAARHPGGGGGRHGCRLGGIGASRRDRRRDRSAPLGDRAGSGSRLAVAGSAIVVGVQLGTARHFRIPAIFGILLPCGYTAAFLLACHSLLLRRGGRGDLEGTEIRLPPEALGATVVTRSDRDAGRALGPGSGMSGGCDPGPAPLARRRLGRSRRCWRSWRCCSTEIRIALLPFIFAVAVAFVLDPLIKRLQRRLGRPALAGGGGALSAGSGGLGCRRIRDRRHRGAQLDASRGDRPRISCATFSAS